MAKMGMPAPDNGSIKDRSTPVSEKENGPSSLRQIQRGLGLTSFGKLSAGQTIEISSVVREMEVKSPWVAQSGSGSSGAWRTTTYGPGRRRNLRWRIFRSIVIRGCKWSLRLEASGFGGDRSSDRVRAGITITLLKLLARTEGLEVNDAIDREDAIEVVDFVLQQF